MTVEHQLHLVGTETWSSGLNTPRKLKVLHVGKFYPPHMGGIETHLQALCRELQKTTDVRVLVASDDRRTEEDICDGVPVSRLANLCTLFATPLCLGMVQRIRRSDADIVHLHWPNPAAGLAYLASGHSGRLVVTYHSDVVRQRVLGALFEPFLHAVLRRASAIVVASPNYLASSPILAKHRERCVVVPYGIEVNSLDGCNPESVRQLRHQHGERVIVSVGRLVYYKGFEHLIRAMLRVDGRLLIIGEGPLRATLEKLAQSLGLSEKVVFLGKVDDLVPYYHAARIFALASVARSEAFGIVQIEAMASGLPVVNTALDSGVPFVSQNGVTGLTVMPGDAVGLGDALNLLLNDAALRQRFGQAARKRAAEEFCLQKMTARVLDIYDQVTNWHSNPVCHSLAPQTAISVDSLGRES
jgi:glycosyltransferase involved in cell wall biosynthesis